MAITYTEERNFTPQQVAELFLSVRWVVGKYPERLHKALMNSSRVISAWDGDRLVWVLFVSWMIASWYASSIMCWFILIIMDAVLLVIC